MSRVHVKRTVADQIVAALTPSPVARLGGPALPLPLVDVRAAVADGSILYEVSRVDASGRLTSSGLVKALGWQRGARLGLAISADGIALQRDKLGETLVSAQGFVVIPVRARSVCGIRNGDRLLLAAAALHGVLIVHTQSTLDAMMCRHYRVVEGGGEVG